MARQSDNSEASRRDRELRPARASDPDGERRAAPRRGAERSGVLRILSPSIIGIIGIGIVSIGGALAFDYWSPGKFLTANISGAATSTDASTPPAKTLEERIAEAAAHSANAKGVYMTSAVANDRGRAATRIREDIVRLLDETELNAVVIDVKETNDGLIITDTLRELVRDLHERGAWVIARQAVFKDDSQEKNHPAWYLKWPDGRIWRDNRKGSWLDPASREVWEYQVRVAKQAVDVGFDEIQLDYVRFPSDGDVKSIVYPVYKKTEPRYDVLRAFFSYFHDEMKTYKPEVMLSADLFGYVAINHQDLGIGQRLKDIGANFDYISLMVYPSHYYAGFQVGPDPERNLPALAYPYRAKNANITAPSQPFDVVYRSMLIASDFLAGKEASTTKGTGENATSTPPAAPVPISAAKMRPWLQDFNLGMDTKRGIVYDAAKVRAQINAAEQAGTSGWLLWNPSNVYTRAALKPETP